MIWRPGIPRWIRVLCCKIRARVFSASLQNNISLISLRVVTASSFNSLRVVTASSFVAPGFLFWRVQSVSDYINVSPLPERIFNKSFVDFFRKYDFILMYCFSPTAHDTWRNLNVCRWTLNNAVHHSVKLTRQPPLSVHHVRGHPAAPPCLYHNAQHKI